MAIVFLLILVIIRRPDETVLVEAKSLMNRGDAAGAQALYAGFIEEHPSDAEALYGLGYALLQQAKIEDAQKAFHGLPDDAQNEGAAAVAYATKGGSARDEILRTLIEITFPSSFADVAHSSIRL